jgi:polyhydroxyalkanoate synthesis regulator phasin
MNGTETVTVDFEKYLHLLNIEKNFDLELKERAKESSKNNIENLKTLHDQLEHKYHMISMENLYKKTTIEELKTRNTNQMFEIQKLKHELESIKNKWWYKLFN